MGPQAQVRTRPRPGRPRWWRVRQSSLVSKSGSQCGWVWCPRQGSGLGCRMASEPRARRGLFLNEVGHLPWSHHDTPACRVNLGDPTLLAAATNRFMDATESRGAAEVPGLLGCRLPFITLVLLCWGTASTLLLPEDRPPLLLPLRPLGVPGSRPRACCWPLLCPALSSSPHTAWASWRPPDPVSWSRVSHRLCGEGICPLLLCNRARRAFPTTASGLCWTPQPSRLSLLGCE